MVEEPSRKARRIETSRADEATAVSTTRIARPAGSNLLDQREGSDLLDQRSSLPRWVLVPAAVAVVAVLVLLGLAFKDWRDAGRLTESASAGQSVRAAVTDKVEALLSYQYDTFDDDRKAAEDSMTGEFQEEYGPTVSEIEDRAVAQKRSQTAQVAAVSVVSASPDEVRTLVFVNTLSSTEGSKKQRLMQNRIEVTMVKQGDSWLIDALTVPTS